jgi:hypothetical protein
MVGVRTYADAPRQGTLARNSSLCPVCGRFIQAGRSRVWRLSEPLAPQRPYYKRDARLGTVRDTRPRRWAHASCADRGEQLIFERWLAS